MIVAHADDDLLWGGMHLIKDKYVVVCVTCGTNELREKEFEKAMKLTRKASEAVKLLAKINGTSREESKNDKKNQGINESR